MTGKGLANARRQSKSAFFTDGGEAKSLELLRQWALPWSSILEKQPLRKPVTLVQANGW